MLRSKLCKQMLNCMPLLITFTLCKYLAKLHQRVEPRNSVRICIQVYLYPGMPHFQASRNPFWHLLVCLAWNPCMQRILGSVLRHILFMPTVQLHLSMHEEVIQKTCHRPLQLLRTSTAHRNSYDKWVNVERSPWISNAYRLLNLTDAFLFGADTTSSAPENAGELTGPVCSSDHWLPPGSHPWVTRHLCDNQQGRS